MKLMAPKGRGILGIKYIIVFFLTIIFSCKFSSTTETDNTLSKGFIKPPDKLITKNIPEIKSDILKKTENYTKTSAIQLLGWKPNETKILVKKREQIVQQIYKTDSSSKKLKKITSFKNPIGRVFLNNYHKDFFLFFKGLDGNEVNQLFLYDINSEKELNITNDVSYRIESGMWSKSNDYFYYTAVKTGSKLSKDDKKTEIRKVNPLYPKTDQLLSTLEGTGWDISDINLKGDKIILQKNISATNIKLWIYNSRTKTKTLLFPESDYKNIVFKNGKFNRDNTKIFFITNYNSEFNRLAFTHVQDEKIEVITDFLSWDVFDFKFSYDEKYIAYDTNEAGIWKLRFIETNSLKELIVDDIPEGQIGNYVWHPKINTIAFDINSNKSLKEIYAVSIPNKNLKRITKTELNGYDTEKSVNPKLIEWKSFDGLHISGFLYKPPTSFKGKRPVIINVHGGPEGQATPRPLDKESYYTNELGIAIIYPNIRGSSGYGKTFLNLDNGYKRENAIKDIGSLLQWIRKQKDLDEDKVMIMGGSYGGYVSLAVAAKYNDKIKCSLSLVGISNFVTFLNNTESYRKDFRRQEYGDERDEKMKEYLNSISPLTKASNIRKPIFIVQGKNDPRVPYTEAEQIVNKVSQNNIPVWYLLALDEGHGFLKKENQDYLFYAQTTFIETFLLSDGK